MAKIKTSQTSGFTLIEIVSGLLLFTVGTLAVIGVLVIGMNAAVNAQSDASAWATAFSVLKDPKPPGALSDSDGKLYPWSWQRSGNTWSASDGSSLPVWVYTTMDVNSNTDFLVPDMSSTTCNNAAVFPSGGNPLPGCSRGWLNGYYVERREQSRASDRISSGIRIIEVRVDVYWASYGQTDGKPLATLVDRVVRNIGP